MKAIKMHCGHGRKKKEGGIDIHSLRRRFSIYRGSEVDEEIMDDRTFD